jgi:thermolabile hemolysin
MNFTRAVRKAKAWRIPVLRTFFPMILAALCLTVITGRSFTALYVFGDSLSDTGRNPAPGGSYFNGRFCNGPLWVEYLSAKLGLPYKAANNFAASGSTTSDLQAEIAGLSASPNLPSGLFTVLSGGNDFLNGVGMGVNDAGWNTVITNAVFNITNALGQLYGLGAREILVGNLADLGHIPEIVGTGGGFPNYLDSKVALFNAMLASAVTNVMQQKPGLRIYFLDDNTLLAAVLISPAHYGFTVTTSGALEDSNLTDKSFNGPGANYLFWDSIHPTTKFDALTAALAFSDVGVQLNISHSGTNFTVTVSNLYPGLPYLLQSSTNLTSWSNYNTFTATTTNATINVTNGGGGKTYYRMVY